MKEINLYLGLRLLLLHSVIFSTVFIQKLAVDIPDQIFKTYTIVFFTFIYTLVFILIAEKAKKVRGFLFSQIAYDVLFTSVLIYYSGAPDSIYIAFYIFNIIFAASIFQFKGALLTSVVSAVIYVTILILDDTKIAKSWTHTAFTTSAALIATAFLSGKLLDDLSRNKQSIYELHEINEKIVNSLDAGLLILDTSGRVQKINQTAIKILNLDTTSHWKNKTLKELVPLLNEVKHSRVHDFNLNGTTKKLSIFKTKLPEFKKGESPEMIVIRDVSQIMETEEVHRRQERLASIGQLTSGIAHELRNPIAAITGSVELLTDSSLTKTESDKLFKTILRESQRVKLLTDELLQYGKPLSIKHEEIVPFNLVNEIIDTLYSQNEVRKINPTIKNEVDPNVKITMNPEAFRQVIGNLVKNSLESFTDHKSKHSAQPIIQIKSKTSNDSVRIFVKDNGPGIPKEYQPRIFDLFFTTKPKGTGLGLALVHRIMTEHKASIKLISDTEFELKFPKEAA